MTLRLIDIEVKLTYNYQKINLIFMHVAKITKENSEVDFCLSIMSDWRNLMFCPNCGAEIKEGYKFCGNCGAEVPILNDSMSTNQSHNMAAFSSNNRDMGYVPSYRDSMGNKKKKRPKGIKIIGAILLVVVVISLINHGGSNSAGKGTDKESKTTERVKKTFTMPEGDTVTEDYVPGSYVASDGSYFMICINQQWTANLITPRLANFVGEDTSSECLMVTDDSTWHPDYAVIDVATKEISLKEDEETVYKYKLDGKELTLRYPNGTKKKYTKVSDRYYGPESIIDKDVEIDDIVGLYRCPSLLKMWRYSALEIGDEYIYSVNKLTDKDDVCILIEKRDQEHVDITCFGVRSDSGYDVYAINEDVPIWEFVGGRVYFFSRGVVYPTYLDFYTDRSCQFSEFEELAEKNDSEYEFTGLDEAVAAYKKQVGSICIYPKEQFTIKTFYYPSEKSQRRELYESRNFSFNFAINTEWYKCINKVYMYRKGVLLENTPYMTFTYSEEDKIVSISCDGHQIASFDPVYYGKGIYLSDILLRYSEGAFYETKKNPSDNPSLTITGKAYFQMRGDRIKLVLNESLTGYLEEWLEKSYGNIPYDSLEVIFFGSEEEIKPYEEHMHEELISLARRDNDDPEFKKWIRKDETEIQSNDAERVIQEDGIFAEGTDQNNEAHTEQVDHDYLWSHATNQADKAYEATCYFLEFFDTYGTRSFISESGKSAISFSEAQHSFRMDYHNISGVTPDDSWEVIDGLIGAGGRNVTLYLRNSQNQEASVTGNYSADAVYFTDIVYRNTEKDYR